VCVCVVAALGTGGVLASSASAAASVSLLGTVNSPATYTPALLAAQPQTTLTISGTTYQGVLVETLVTSAAPIYPAPPGNNPALRVAVTATSDAGGPNAGPVTFALGELAANFGNNKALVALTENGAPPSGGPKLVLPRDTSGARFVTSLAQLNIAVRTEPHSTPPAGGVIVRRGATTTTLTAAALAALPQTTMNVTFMAGAGTTANTEVGPILADVLSAAGITPGPNTYVSAVATDNYIANVTPAEAGVGNRPLMLALQETVTATGAPTSSTPRLVTNGDLRGGRYVSNVTDLIVSEGGAAKATTVSGAASSPTGTSAELAGTVNPNGLPATYTFEYGTSLSFGAISTPSSVPSSSGDTPVSASLAGLTSNTTYYYRAVATSAAGTSLGIVRSFRTAGTAQAPTAVTLPPTSTTDTSAGVAGQVNPNGQQTAYTFEYGTSTSFGAISAVVALDDGDGLEPVSATLTELTPNTTYYYRVVATNATGTSPGVVRSFDTGPGGAPIVTTAGASAITGTGASLAGTVDANGLQTSFAFEYGTTTAFGSLSAIDSAGAGYGSHAVSLPIAGLAPNTTYRFRVVATNAAGTTAGAVQGFTTGPAS
jgi:hypothetical protein